MSNPFTRVVAPPPVDPLRTCVKCEVPLVGYPPDVWVCVDDRIPDATVFPGLHEAVYVDPSTGETCPLTPQLFIEGSSWRFAKSMPKIPHEYTVRDLTTADHRKSTCLSHDTFEWFVRLTREQGEAKTWRKGRVLRYLTVEAAGETWKYWTMGHAPEHTTIINRERVQDPERFARLFDD